MTYLINACRRIDAAVLSSVRGTQAVVVEALDRLVGGRGAHRPGGQRSPLGRLFNFQLEVMDLWVGDTASQAQESFDRAVRLLVLQREFLQRILEAADTRDATRITADSQPVAAVVHLERSSRRRR
jgi:hypothetical protein